MSAILTLALKEFEDHLRNGWIVALALAFALFASVISLAGFGFTGQVGITDSRVALMSLTSLVLYLIPLMALLLGFDAIAGERDRGTLDLLCTYPVSAAQIVLGKLLGLEAVLVVMQVLGLVPPAAMALAAGGAWWPWPVFLALSSMLGAVFLALALWLSAVAREKGMALGMALALWLVLVILFDIGLIGLLVATGGSIPAALVQGLFYLNPASLYRVLSFSALLDAAALREMGLGLGALPPWSAVLALCLWCVAPLGLATWRLQRAA